MVGLLQAEARDLSGAHRWVAGVSFSVVGPQVTSGRCHCATKLTRLSDGIGAGSSRVIDSTGSSSSHSGGSGGGMSGVWRSHMNPAQWGRNRPVAVPSGLTASSTGGDGQPGRRATDRVVHVGQDHRARRVTVRGGQGGGVTHGCFKIEYGWGMRLAQWRQFAYRRNSS